MTGQSSEDLYGRLPVPLQHLACSGYGFLERRRRLSPEFHRRLESLLESETWSRSEIDAFQDEHLRALIEHAYERIPYYREAMHEHRLKPGDITSRADLPKLPLLTKELVRRNQKKLVDPSASKRDLELRHTSGTTGSSLHFYASRSLTPAQWAVWWRHRMRFGLSLGDLHANFTGKMAVPAEQGSGAYWRWNWPMHQALLNMHHLTSDKIADVVDFLNRHPFAFYSGYPSILHILAKSALDAGLVLKNRPRVVVTSAENILELQGKEIVAFTGAILTDQYGFTEGCGNASHCEHFAYHEDFELGIVELLDAEGDEPADEAGSVVCTGFASPHAPLIRYEVGDVASWSGELGCPCGRSSRILKEIHGRKDDYVITPEGRHIMRFDYVFKDAANIRESQIVQQRLGEITVLIVKDPRYKSEDEAYVRDEIARWISPRLAVQFDYVGEIPRETGGKFRAVRSELRQ